MRGDDGSLFGLDRGSLTAIGAIMMGIGIILFLIAATSMMPSTSDPFDFAATSARMRSSFVTPTTQTILLAVGFGGFRLGVISPAPAYVAFDASPAIDEAPGAASVALE